MRPQGTERPLDARVIAAGSELLGDRADTNGPEACRRLARRGARVTGLDIVPDDAARLRDAIAAALGQVALVVVTGGLGPTADDLTRDAAAAVLGVDLVPDEASERRLEEAAAARGATLTAASRAMASVPRGARVVANPVGTAVGSVTATGSSVLVLLPGPPGEMLAMLDPALDAAWRALAERGLLGSTTPVPHAVLRLAGLGESVAEARLAGLAGATLSFLCRPGDVEVHLRAADPAALEGAVARARAALAPHVYSDDGRSLAEVVVPVLAERFERLAVAESCTGGLIAAAVTSVPGSSRVFERGFVTYADDAKVELLGVMPSLLAAHGAVSDEVAEAMALGARRRGRADWALAVTGIAGPDGGTPEKPVGRVHVALAHPDGRVESERHAFTGDREGVRARSVQAALDLLRRRLTGLPD